ncbi:PadR family transcriptional regulator [Nonomuraea guangzhouensis]|uniref:PadR family transcriptional regulator n=1 Tax=Nonomuraea guangzhouensis TaxID=1291555 RepID=A0ABW4G2M1_9ACTN|nr:helix-turn-helix transcriptional regulator [Nonomuraea guangzhouensis]
MRQMQEPSFLILTALAAGPQHGYGVITDVERISDGQVRLRAGTLYAAFDRLQAEGLITEDREVESDCVRGSRHSILTRNPEESRFLNGKPFEIPTNPTSC